MATLTERITAPQESDTILAYYNYQLSKTNLNLIHKQNLIER